MPGATLFRRQRNRRQVGLPINLLTGLVAYWNLDEESGNRADSHGSFTLTDNNTVTSGDGVGDGQTAALFVAANTEFLSHADHADLRVGDRDWSFFGFARLDDLSAAYNLAGKTNVVSSSGDEYEIQVASSTGTVSFIWRDSEQSQHSIEIGSVLAEAWFLVEAGFNATLQKTFGSINDGSRVFSASETSVRVNNNAFVLGADNAGGTNALNGRMSAWGVKHGILTDTQRTALFNEGTAALLYDDLESA